MMPFDIPILLACLAMSFLLSGMEAGVFAMSRLRVRQQMRAGRRSARRLYAFLENPENFLWTILVGNTIVNFIILGWIVPKLHAQLGGNRLLFIGVFAVVVFLFFALCDLLPKMLFRTYPNRLCMFAARPFRIVHFALRPLVAVVEWASALVLRRTGAKAFAGHLFGNREELRQFMQDTGQQLSSEERAMINRVLDLQSLTVRQTVIPLAQTVVFSTATTVRDALAVARERNLSRFPVVENRDGLQRTVGLVSIETLMFLPETEMAGPVNAHLQPALFLEEDLRLEVALRRMQRGGQRLAVVLGRDNVETGILSLEDILKIIFGEVKL